MKAFVTTTVQVGGDSFKEVDFDAVINDKAPVAILLETLVA